MKVLIITVISILLISACSENACNCPGLYSNFKISTKTYSEKIDLDSVILTDYGPDYRMADWQDLLKIQSIHNWADEVGLQNDSSYHIKNNGERFWDNRSYFITRFDEHDKPSHFFAHDDIDSNFICLGSWYNHSLKILLVKK